MGQCKERVCSWWPSSSSRIIVLVIIPLFVALVSAAAVMGGIDWIFASYYSWQWRSCTCLPSPPPSASSSQPTGTEEPKYNNVEEDLESARAAIREARNDEEDDDQTHDPHDYIPRGPIYLNATAFHRSYLEMEKKFRVFVYEQGDPPVFHFGPRKGLYSVEGQFIQNMETSRFRTSDPEQAHAYFLPFSVTMMTQVVYMDDDWIPMIDIAKHYVNAVSRKYRFWNRSLGADHFMLACHDWGPNVSMAVPNLHNNSIRALCNANTSEFFNPVRDVSIPEIYLPAGTTDGMLGGPPPSQRSILVFFAGGVYGPVRPALIQHWGGNQDPDVQINSYLPEGESYYELMRKSKYCICPSGYEIASPRMVEALYMGCVPVLIKKSYVPPFSDVLNWKAFSVVVSPEDIPELKKILAGIPEREYMEMHRRGQQVRRHFEIGSPAKRYDVFHMILHSIWMRRLNIRVREN